MSLYSYIAKKSKYLFIIWFLMIILFSFIPIIKLPRIRAFGMRFRSDYLIHFIEYFVLSIFFIFWRMAGRQKIGLKNLGLYLLIGMGISALVEGFQTIIPDRSFNMRDLVSNCIGFVVGIFIMFFILKIKGKKEASPHLNP